MKNILFAALCGSMLFFSSAYAKEVHDWKDLKKVHEQVQKAIHEMERAAAANHYDMDGHAKKAEEALRQAERELHEAVESAKAMK